MIKQREDGKTKMKPIIVFISCTEKSTHATRFYFPSSTFCCFSAKLLLLLQSLNIFFFIAKTRHLSIRGFFFIVYQLCVCICTTVEKKYKQRRHNDIYNTLKYIKINKHRPNHQVDLELVAESSLNTFLKENVTFLEIYKFCAFSVYFIVFFVIFHFFFQCWLSPIKTNQTFSATLKTKKQTPKRISIFVSHRDADNGGLVFFRI